MSLCQGGGAVSDALRETWELYEQRAASGRPVPIRFLVDAWGSGYGDCAEVGLLRFPRIPRTGEESLEVAARPSRNCRRFLDSDCTVHIASACENLTRNRRFLVLEGPVLETLG